MSNAGTSRRVERGGKSGQGERRPRSDDMLPGLEEIEARHEGEDGSLSVGPVERTDVDGPLIVSPEDALADATRLLTEKDARIEAEAAARRTAEDELAKSRTQLSTKESEALQNREAAIANAVTAAAGKREAAKAQVKAAREAGNQDAEMDAIDSLTQANAELLLANRNKEGFEAWKRAQGNRPAAEPRQQQTQAADGPSDEAQAWLGSHPLYFSQTDEGREYQAQALAAHSAALSRRIPEGSKAYVDFIEGRMEKIFGKDHGQISHRTKDTTDMADTRVPRQQRRASSTSAPTSREGGYEYSARGGDFEYVDKASGAKLRLVEAVDRDGRPTETVQGTIPAQWREFAKINRMTDIAYAVEQLKIQRDIADGGNLAGLAYERNGAYS